MSYASRKRLRHNSLTVITWFLVLVNLVPIAWMVYCGVKDNQEILAGKTTPGRRQNEVTFLAETASGYLAGSADGGITLFDKTNLVKSKHLNLGTFATSYLLDINTLWVLSSNRGLQAVDINSFKKTKDFSIPTLATVYGKDWKTLWVNEVSASSLIKSKDLIFLSFEFKGYPGVTSFNVISEKFATVPEISSDETGLIRKLVSTPNMDSIALVGTDGIFFMHSPSGTKGKSIVGNSKLPAAPNQVCILDSNRMLITADSRAYLYSITAESVLTWIDRPENGGVITTVTGSSENLWIGDSRGITSMKIASLGIQDTAKTDTGTTAKTLYPGDEDISASRITAILPLAEGKVLVGGPKGTLRMVDSSGHRIAAGIAPAPAFYIHWRNYVDLWRNIDFGLYLKNSFIVCLSVMCIAMVLASMGGYALARYNFPGKSSFGYSVLATQMVPGIMLLLPLYLMFVNISHATGIIVKGTYTGLILTYSAYFIPFSIWILRGFFASLPKELEEAALVDGCGPFQAFFRIIIPSAMPGIIATGVYVFLSAWDELMFAWVLTSEKTYTIPVGIRLFVGNFQNRYDLMMAAATVSTLPVMFLFFLMQKQIVSGLTAGAVKE